jgi:hypothetical protein
VHLNVFDDEPRLTEAELVWGGGDQALVRLPMCNYVENMSDMYRFPYKPLPTLPYPFLSSIN